VNHELIDRYALGGELLTYAAQGLSRELQIARPGPGAWSILEVVMHLADSDLVGADRMKRVIAEDNPTLLAYDQNAWASRLHYQDGSLEDAVQLFAINRRSMARLLQKLAPEDFARAGTHSEQGRQTLAQMVTKYTHHLDSHLRFIYAKRSNVGVSLYPRYAVD